MADRPPIIEWARHASPVQEEASFSRRLLPFLWMAALYAATAVNEILHIGPEDPRLLEAQQIAVHTVCYAIQGWLLARAVGGPAAALIGLALIVGLGQEVLQSLWRGQITALGSAIDLAVDGVGAALGLWLFGRWRKSRLKQIL